MSDISPTKDEINNASKRTSDSFTKDIDNMVKKGELSQEQIDKAIAAKKAKVKK